MTFIFYEDVDERLVSAFIERWNPETNSFHMPFEEMTITLADVYFLLGIKIQGESMGVSTEEMHLQVRERHSKKLTEVGAALGIRLEKCGCSWANLKAACEEEGRYDDDTKGSAYLLFMISMIMFPDKTQNLVNYSHWEYVKDLSKVNKWSWGSGLLASVYRDLGTSSRFGCKKISTCYTLVLVSFYIVFCFNFNLISFISNTIV